MAKWFINMKKADFNGIARKYGVSTGNRKDHEKPGSQDR